MTREAEVKALMLADPTLEALLPGGVYTEQEVGVEGIRRGTSSPTADAFNADGTLRTCALVREGPIAPMAGTRVVPDKAVGLMQTIYIYFYEMRGKDEIVPAKERTVVVLENVRLTASYPMHWAFETPPIPDAGPIINSTGLRQEWNVVSFRVAA